MISKTPNEREGGLDPADTLRQLLSVEPSPEFVARIRQRVAQEEPRSTLMWRLAAAAFAVVCLVAGPLWRASQPEVQRPPANAGQRDTKVLQASPRVSNATGEAPASVISVLPNQELARPFLAPTERLAVQRLVRMSDEGLVIWGVTGNTVADDDVTIAPLSDLRAIEIVPVGFE